MKGKHIVLGVSGSIAAYKAADVASKLVQAGAQVSVILTAAAQQFVTPLTFRSLTHRPVVTNWFDPGSDLSIQHVTLAETADALLVAPATADLMAKLAAGMADDPLTGTALATQAPLVLAPAMDAHMYEHPATQANLRTLTERGALLVGPEPGRLASGLIGMGRLAATEAILAAVSTALGRSGDLKGRTVVVSAGPTEEPLDPVRVITNRSSGKMGYAIAEAARDRGARVVLVTGPTALSKPWGIDVRGVHTTAEMLACVQASSGADALIMAAAPGDFRPETVAPDKIKKGPEATLTITLLKNPDILSAVSGFTVKAGFAAESRDLLDNARAKLTAKGLDFIVANDVAGDEPVFGSDLNKVTVLDAGGGVDDLPRMTKAELAGRILDRVVAALAGKERV
ncbi:MAG: bifunctional phosphopantothenoylcysteine decarboxylase/phosphopantothenate--cysteine ligase CoaBC [Dehalococcoidia bacterium]|nr:bifunctional phosphopantothenoylcysteine decarboxylase/phosphopantothenate--cysteine ligase CoaBC [Dehalococcoidia bacterium]